jgi:hypothetical protein
VVTGDDCPESRSRSPAHSTEGDRNRNRDRHQGRSGRDRGQLLLIGAVGVAFIIVGLAVVVNSMVLTGASGTGISQASDESVALLNHEVQRDTRSLVIHTNHRRVYDDNATLNASVAENVSEYNRLLGETYAESSGAFVNVSYTARNETGTRIVQATDRNYTSPPAGFTPPGTGRQDNYTVIGPARTGMPDEFGDIPRGQVGWFVMNVNASETTDRTKRWFNVTVFGSGGRNVTLYMNQNATGEGVSSALDVESDVSTSPGIDTNVTCLSSGDRVLIDVVAGRCVNDQGKTFTTLEALDPPYRITVRNGTQAYGKYGIVTNATATAFAGPRHNCPTTTPCLAPAAWSVNVSVTYRTEQTRYSNVQSVTVYNESN